MMKRLMFLILSLAVLIGMGLATSAAIAGEGIYGQMRWRWEGFKNYDFTSDANDAWGQNLLRSRIGYKTTIGEHGMFKMSVENTHILGGDWGYASYDPFYLYGYDKQGPSGYGEDIYLNEAVLGIKDFATEGLDLYGGRMHLSYGNQRIIGPDDWAMNHENRFDGFKSHYAFEDGWFDLLCLWLAEAGPYKWNTGDGDINLRGLYGHYDVNEQFYFEPYILWLAQNHNDISNYPAPDTAGLKTDNMMIFGALLDYMSDNGLHVYAEGTLESATIHDFAPNPDIDWSALGFYGGVFYTVDNELEPFLGVEFNYASGTSADDFTNDKIKTFVSPFGSFSNYMGRMNFVGWSNTASLRFSGGLTPTEGLDFKVDFYLFKLAKDEDAAYFNISGDMLYNDNFVYWPGQLNADGVFDKSVGTEIDIFLNYNVEEGVDVEAGLGMFSAGDYFGPDANLDSVMFGWLGAQVGIW
jgi:hypothetical protein